MAKSGSVYSTVATGEIADIKALSPDVLPPGAVEASSVTKVRLAYVNPWPTDFTRFNVAFVKGICNSLGWDFKYFSSKEGTVDQVQSAFDAAIISDPDVIFGAYLPGSWLGDQLEKTRSKGILTVNVQADETTGQGFDIYIGWPTELENQLVLHYIYTQEQGQEAEVLSIWEAAYPAYSIPGSQELAEQMNINMEMVKSDTATMFDPVKTEQLVTAEISRRPDLDYVNWETDNMSADAALSAVRSSGRLVTTEDSPSDGIVFFTKDGYPVGFSMLQRGETPFYVGLPAEWAYLAAFDQTLRKLGGGTVAEGDFAYGYIANTWYPEDVQPLDVSDWNAILQFNLSRYDFFELFEALWGVTLPRDYPY